jgi:hypothetical protein
MRLKNSIGPLDFPEDVLLRVLAFAGLLHLHDGLCRRTRHSALGRRLRFNDTFCNSLGVAVLPGTAADALLLCGFDQAPPTKKLYDVLCTAQYICECFCDDGMSHAHAVKAQRDDALRRWHQQQGRRRYQLHDARRARRHLTRGIEHYTQLPHELAVRLNELRHLQDNYGGGGSWWTGDEADGDGGGARETTVVVCGYEWLQQLRAHREGLFNEAAPADRPRTVTLASYRHRHIYRGSRWLYNKKFSRAVRALIY